VRASVCDGLKRERELFMQLMESSQSKPSGTCFCGAGSRKNPRPARRPADQKHQIRCHCGRRNHGRGHHDVLRQRWHPRDPAGDEPGKFGARPQHHPENYANSVSKGSLKQTDMDQRLGLIRPTLSYDDLRNADLIIEAVFEEMPIRRKYSRSLTPFANRGPSSHPILRI